MPCTPKIVDFGVVAVAVEEAMWGVAAGVNPDDLAFVVDAQGIGAFCAEGIVERSVGHVSTPFDEDSFQFVLGSTPCRPIVSGRPSQ